MIDFIINIYKMVINFFLTYIAEVGSIYPCQNKLRAVHDQREICKTFFSTLRVEPLQITSEHQDETRILQQNRLKETR